MNRVGSKVAGCRVFAVTRLKMCSVIVTAENAAVEPTERVADSFEDMVRVCLSMKDGSEHWGEATTEAEALMLAAQHWLKIERRGQ